MGALKRIELLDRQVKQFFALIRFEDRDRLNNCIQFTRGAQEL